MFGWLKNIFDNVKDLNSTIDTYKKDTIIQSLPSLAFVNRAKKLIDEKKYDEAEKILKEALDFPQEDPLVYKYLGVVYERTNKHEFAVENYQKSADLNPNDKNIWQRLGFSLMSLGEHERAEKSFENADKILPKNSDTLTGWGMAFIKQKDYSQAREKFLQAVASNKYNFTAMFLCAVVEVKLEMYDKAESKLNFLSNVAPNASNTYEMASLKMLKKDYENAAFYAKKSLEYKSDMYQTYLLLGQIFCAKQDLENSLKYFNEAQEKGFDNKDLYLDWGKALLQFEKYQEGLEKLLKAYEFDSEDDEAAAFTALAYALNGNSERAEELVEKGKDQEGIVWKTVKGILSFEKGEIEPAIILLRSDEEDAINCYYLARCFEKLGNQTKAVDFYEAAVRLYPDYTQAYIYYVKYLAANEDYRNAQRKLRKIVKTNENNTILLNMLFNVNYILVKDNLCEYNVKETIEIAEKIENINPDLFEYPEKKAELIQLLQDMKEK